MPISCCKIRNHRGNQFPIIKHRVPSGQIKMCGRGTSIGTKWADLETLDLSGFRCRFRAGKFEIHMRMSFHGSNSKPNAPNKFELRGIETCEMKIVKSWAEKIKNREKNCA